MLITTDIKNYLRIITFINLSNISLSIGLGYLNIPKLFELIPLTGYGFAWVGHFFIEKNRPATFTYPFYSLAGDFVMFWDILTGQINKKISVIDDQPHEP